MDAITGRRRFLRVAGALCLVPDTLHAGEEHPKPSGTRTIPRGSTLTLDIATDGNETLKSTLDGIAQWRIEPGALVVLRLADGIHHQLETLRLSHSDGARIHI